MAIQEHHLWRCCCAFRHRAHTLLELLVSIAIVGILFSLLLAAVQMAREAARQTHCRHNLSQLGVAMMTHHSTYGHFPSGGWGYLWVGDPDRGSGPRQPGGWIIPLLPYLEQGPSYTLGAGGDTFTKKAGATQQMQLCQPIMTCPTRRACALYPYVGRPPHNANWVAEVAKSDYAVNAGDVLCGMGSGPVSLLQGDHPNYGWPEVARATGICYLRSRISFGEVSDGASNTYCIGEKYRTTEKNDMGDDQSAYTGYDFDTFRWADASYQPKRDSAAPAPIGFGSMHSGGCNFVFVDGSTRSISYQIAPEVHRRLGNRMDQMAVTIEVFP